MCAQTSQTGKMMSYRPADCLVGCSRFICFGLDGLSFIVILDCTRLHKVRLEKTSCKPRQNWAPTRLASLFTRLHGLSGSNACDGKLAEVHLQKRGLQMNLGPVRFLTRCPQGVMIALSLYMYVYIYICHNSITTATSSRRHAISGPQVP